MTCATNPDPSQHWEAVFAHVTSSVQGIPIRAQLAKVGFKGIQFEKDYCDDVELSIPGVDLPTQRAAITREAKSVKVPVSFESQDEQKINKPSEVTAVFGTLPTLKRANALQWAIATKGWQYTDIVRVSIRSWKVTFPHIPSSSQSSFAAEAAKAGYHISYEG